MTRVVVVVVASVLASLVSAIPASRASAPATSVAVAAPRCARAPIARLRPRTFVFPRDDGAHADFETEWWRTFGRLTDASGGRYDLSVAISRFAIDTCAETQAPRHASRWRARSMFTLAYELFEEATGQTLRGVRVERAGPLGGIAAVRHLGLAVSGARFDATPHAATRPDFNVAFLDRSIALSENVRNGAVPLGPHGVMITGSCTECAAYAYAYPRNATTGNLRIAGVARRVVGSMWFEHEFAHRELAANEVGWKRFEVTFDDGRALDARITIGRAGSVSRSSGALIAANGSVTYLEAGDANADTFPPNTVWHSAQSDVTYPSSWLLGVGPGNLSLAVSEIEQDQEIRALGRSPFFMGPVTVESQTQPGDTGFGFVELTGVAQPVVL